tara:strand:+ start:160 stop:816 length:657 start_codon:yes stop_codon:yes gene_type:complete
MHKTIINLIEIEKEIYSKNLRGQSKVRIIAISKTFSIDKILPLVDHGHIDFGENKVQEAVEKWTKLKATKSNIKLHMVGKLQTNKVKYAVKLFDYIHSLDSIKLAKKISEEQAKVKKDLKIFIQINIGNENQKNGITIEELPQFYKICKKDFNLNIVGLMCLPPLDNDPSNYFAKMQKISNDYSFRELSMGMSSDYLTAIQYNSSFVRIGSKIFGKRN